MKLLILFAITILPFCLSRTVRYTDLCNNHTSSKGRKECEKRACIDGFTHWNRFRCHRKFFSSKHHCTGPKGGNYISDPKARLKQTKKCSKLIGLDANIDNDYNLVAEEFQENGYSSSDLLIAFGAGVGLAAFSLFFKDRK